MLWHIMSQKFKSHQLQLWGCWVWLRAVDNKGSQRTSVQEISSLFKATQMPSPKQIQQATDAGSPTTVTRAEEHEPIQLCPRFPRPASSLFAVPYGRCQSNWSFLSSSPSPVSDGETRSGFLRVPLCSGRAGILQSVSLQQSTNKAGCQLRIQSVTSIPSL